MLMKQLLRSGWIRAGVPKSEIESLADHSWAVTVYAYFFCIQENSMRSEARKKQVNIEKTVLMALFHDFLESEYMDLDKSFYNVINPDKIDKFIEEIEFNALKLIIGNVSSSIGTSLQSLFSNQDSEEYQMVKISDYYDLLVQTRYYSQKHWINEKDRQSFNEHALKKLVALFNKFLFLKPHLTNEGFLSKE
jgi:putative hydrolase of HD superfamily